MFRNFVTISGKDTYLLEFTNCIRKDRNSCTKMQHILSFLDKNNICLGQLLFCEEMQAGFGDQVPKSLRQEESYQTDLQKAGNNDGDQAGLRLNQRRDVGRQGWIRSYGRHRDRRGKNGQEKFSLKLLQLTIKIFTEILFSKVASTAPKNDSKLLTK